MGERFQTTIIKRPLSSSLICCTLQNRQSGPHLFNCSYSGGFTFCFSTSMKEQKPKNNIDLIKIHHLTDHIHWTPIVRLDHWYLFLRDLISNIRWHNQMIRADILIMWRHGTWKVLFENVYVFLQPIDSPRITKTAI